MASIPGRHTGHTSPLPGIREGCGNCFGSTYTDGVRLRGLCRCSRKDVFESPGQFDSRDSLRDSVATVPRCLLRPGSSNCPPLSVLPMAGWATGTWRSLGELCSPKTSGSSDSWRIERASRLAGEARVRSAATIANAVSDIGERAREPREGFRVFKSTEPHPHVLEATSSHGAFAGPAGRWTYARVRAQATPRTGRPRGATIGASIPGEIDLQGSRSRSSRSSSR